MTDETKTEAQTQAVNEPTTTEEPQVETETFTREYVEKLRKENATYRTKAKEAAEKADKARTEAERAKLDEVERLKAERADALKEAEAARAEAKRTRHLITLAGKVTDPEDALLIAERAGLVTDDGVDLDALLKAKPYLAPPQPGVSIPGARTSKTAALTPEDVQRMTPDQINERWAEVQAVLKR